MKIFVLLSRFPYPLEKGDKLRAYHQLKILSKRHEIFLCCLSDKVIETEHLAPVKSICAELKIIQLSKFKIYFNVLKQAFSEKPFQVGYFWQRRAQKEVDSYIAAFQPDHIYCQLIRTTEYVKAIYDIPKTLDYMDALGQGMIRRSKISTGIRKWIFKNEGKRLLNYENRIFDHFNHHLIISEQDQKHISHPDQSKIAVVENGIAERFFENVEVRNKPVDLVFVGNMNYPPNIACAKFLVQEIVPEIKKKHPNISCLLAGANPSTEVQNLALVEGVEVSGWVDDIRSAYARGSIFVAPLFIGTGLQNKLLEAMAQGIPCITTSLANNALKAQPNNTILVADNAEAFATCIDKLMNDKELYQSLSLNGKNYVKTTFSWERSVAKLEAFFVH